MSDVVAAPPEPTPVDRRPPPAVFESLAVLYGPADPRHRSHVVEAGDGWRVPDAEAPDVEVLLWGRLARNQRPTVASTVDAMRREIALLHLRARPPGGMHLAEIHRLPAVRRPGRLRRRLRSVLLGGLMVELVRHERPTRVIDEVVAAAGARSLGPGLRPSGDGSALARLHLIDGRRAELRVAPTGHPKDPMHGREALIALEAAGVSHVPRPLGCGRTSGAVWTTETVLRGRHALRLTPELIADVAVLCAELPAATTPSRAIRDQLDDVARVFPTLTGRLRAVATAAEAWAGDMPAVLLHGDLWLNNLLVREGRLSGLFDWETWHPAGLPGTDLLNLLAADERSRSGRDVGALLLADYWRSEPVLEVLRGYFAARGLPFPDAQGLAAIAVGWWASRVAGALERGGRPTADPQWVRTNLDEPLAWLAERVDAGRIDTGRG
jgi:hypothetical protein